MKKLFIFFILNIPLIYFIAFFNGSFKYAGTKQFYVDVLSSVAISFFSCLALYVIDKKGKKKERINNRTNKKTMKFVRLFIPTIGITLSIFFFNNERKDIETLLCLFSITFLFVWLADTFLVERLIKNKNNRK